MSISLTYLEVSWRFYASKICLFCRRINDVINSFTVRSLVALMAAAAVTSVVW